MQRCTSLPPYTYLGPCPHIVIEKTVRPVCFPFLEHINQLLWGFPVLILLSSAHLYFTAKLKFPQRLTLKAIRLSVTPEKNAKGANLSGFAALATTLAATLGTGNIIGVSTAIAIGGPGALFWCWITGGTGNGDLLCRMLLKRSVQKTKTG